MAGSAGGSDEPEFQIAPMIDVLLVMLIFFMSITTTQVLKVDKEVNLPVAPNAAKKDDKRSEAIVNVRWDAKLEKPTWVMDDKIYQRPSELVEPLKLAKERGDQIKEDPNLNFRVIIRADKDAHAQAVSQAMNAAAEAGIVDISFSAINKS